jgi:rare lipoprotein A
MFSPAGRGDRVPPSPDDDELRPRVQVPRSRLAFAFSATLAAVPLLVLDNLPASADERHADEPVVEARRRATTSTEAAVDDLDPTSTITVAPPAPATTSTTSAPAARAAPVVAAERAPSTTVAPPTTIATTTTTSPRPAQTGDATWYAQPSSYAANGCAHPSLPFGTLVVVTSRGSGRSTTCAVNDRGPFTTGRIIDLDDDVFARIAPLESGVISVSITW